MGWRIFHRTGLALCCRSRLSSNVRPHIFTAVTTQPLTPEDQAALIALEESMWRNESRFDLAFQEHRFAPDFVEFGRSGRRYDRSTIVDVGAPGEQLRARLPLTDLEVHVLAEDAALVTYTSEVEVEVAELQRANRSSIWVLRQGRWRLRFHKGTPT